tara:strand:- start:1184 stop:1333 length:150 start_codon:yes stop_codon:yes gene_type:complete
MNMNNNIEWVHWPDPKAVDEFFEQRDIKPNMEMGQFPQKDWQKFYIIKE